MAKKTSAKESRTETKMTNQYVKKGPPKKPTNTVRVGSQTRVRGSALTVTGPQQDQRSPSQKREDLKRLVDALSEKDLGRAEQLLASFEKRKAKVLSHFGSFRSSSPSPLLRALERAPVDDEPETENEARTVAVARQQVARGDVLTHAQVAARSSNERKDRG